MDDLRTYAEIDLDAIAHNVRELRRITDPSAELIAVVKADGYGHGAEMVGKTALKNGADRLAVALVDEGLALREKGIDAPILVFGYIPPVLAETAIKNGLTLTVFSKDLVEALVLSSKRLGSPANVHVKIDTGMNRVGIKPEEAIDFIKWLKTQEGIIVEGIYTHFASADERDKTYAKTQFGRFCRVLKELEEEGIKIPLPHCANSAAIIDLPETHLKGVRAGIAIYGLWPSPEVDHSRLTLQPAMCFKTRVSRVKTVPSQVGVGYGRTYYTARESLLAALPVGYADGYTRGLSGRAEVLLKGKRIPVVGRICMDQCMVDATGLAEVEVGDEVVLFGRQGEQFLAVEELAEILGTISYELVCGVGKRVPRVYRSRKTV
jgi:alanine racemase